MFVRVSSRSSKLTERGNMLLREREKERKKVWGPCARSESN